MADPDIENLGARLRDSIGDLGSSISSGLDRLAALLIPAAQAAAKPPSAPKPTPTKKPETPSEKQKKEGGTTGGAVDSQTNKKDTPSIEALFNSLLGPNAKEISFEPFSNLTKNVGLRLFFSELEKSGAAFRSLNTAGVAFSGGLLELRQTANQAGLTIAQFSSAIKENSAAIASTGLGMNAGTKKIASSLEAGGRQLTSDLLRMGYDFNEFGGLVADTMSIMRTAGAPLRATDEQVAQETRKYAENLRIISAITGEDAKKRMNEAKEAAKQLAFQQKIAGLGAEQQAAIMRAMGNMSPLMQKAFMEQVVFGGMVSKVTAATGSMIPAFGEVVKQAGDLATAGQLDEERFRDLMKDRGATLEQEMRTLSGVPEAAMLGVGGIISELGPALNGLYEYAKVYSPEAITKAKENLNNQMTTQDALTRAYTSLAEITQGIKVGLEKALTEIMNADNIINMANRVVNLAMIGLDQFVIGIYKATEAIDNFIDELKKQLGLGVPKRAAGGPVQENMVYQVGELGPELFVPSTNGTIISNDRVRNMLSRPSSDLTNTIESMQNSIANAVSLAISKPGTVRIDAATKHLLREQLAIQKQHITALSDMQRVLDDMRGQDQRYYSYSA